MVYLKINTSLVLFYILFIFSYACGGERPIVQIGSKQYTYSDLCGKTQKEYYDEFDKQIGKFTLKQIKRASGAITYLSDLKASGIEAARKKLREQIEIKSLAQIIARKVNAAVYHSLLSELKLKEEDFFEMEKLLAVSKKNHLFWSEIRNSKINDLKNFNRLKKKYNILWNFDYYNDILRYINDRPAAYFFHGRSTFRSTNSDKVHLEKIRSNLLHWFFKKSCTNTNGYFHKRIQLRDAKRRSTFFKITISNYIGDTDELEKFIKIINKNGHLNIDKFKKFKLWRYKNNGSIVKIKKVRGFRLIKRGNEFEVAKIYNISKGVYEAYFYYYKFDGKISEQGVNQPAYQEAGDFFVSRYRAFDKRLSYKNIKGLIIIKISTEPFHMIASPFPRFKYLKKPINIDDLLKEYMNEAKHYNSYLLKSYNSLHEDGKRMLIKKIKKRKALLKYQPFRVKYNNLIKNIKSAP